MLTIPGYVISHNVGTLSKRESDFFTQFHDFFFIKSVSHAKIMNTQGQ